MDMGQISIVEEENPTPIEAEEEQVIVESEETTSPAEEETDKDDTL